MPHFQRKVLVTGASGGIGLAVARRFAMNGDALFLHAFQNVERLESLRREFPDVPMEIYCCDLSQPSAQDALVESAWCWRPGSRTDGDGSLDVLVQAAGVDILTGVRKTWTFEQKLDALWRIDVQAGIRIARNLTSRLQQTSHSGSIFMIGWNAVEWGMAGDSAELFAAAKGAVTAFARSLAQKAGPLIRVHCIAPGWIQTLWGQSAPQEWQNHAAKDALVGRWGLPADVASAIFFLASPEAGFLNALNLPVDGGKRFS